MPASNLASARSVFEQNIQKNKEAGCDRNLLGQKPSRKITNRLFAQKRFYGATNNASKHNNDSNRSLNSRNSNADHIPLRTSFHKETSTTNTIGKSYDFNSHTKNQNAERQAAAAAAGGAPLSQYFHHQQQEEPRAECKPPSGHSREGYLSVGSNHSAGGSSHGATATATAAVSEQQETSNARDAFAKKKKEGSISSLADHLGKLNLSISRGRSGLDDNASYSSNISQNSTTIEAHKNRVTLPDFRQSSFRSRRPPPPVVNNVRRRLDGGDSSFSSLDNSNQSCDIDTSSQSFPVVRRSSPLDGSSQSNLDASGQTYESYQGLRRSSSTKSQFRPTKTSSNDNTDLDITRRVPFEAAAQAHRIELKRSSKSRKSASTRTLSTSNRGKLMRHLSNESNNGNAINQSNHSSNSEISHNSTKSEQIVMTRRAHSKDWSRPTSASGHNARGVVVEPLTAVPFPTRTVIKRHNSKQKGNSTTTTTTNTNTPPSASSLTRRSAVGVRRSMSQRRQAEQQQQQQQHRHQQKSPPPETATDPEEQALLDEIERLKVQINSAETRVVQVEAGEKADLKRVQETKDRKLRRIENTEKHANSPDSNDYEYELELEEECKKAQQTIKNLKKDNAKIHDETRQLKIQILTTASSNGLMEESKAEMDRYNAEMEKELKRQQREHEQLSGMLKYYQDSISGLEEALTKKDPEINRVKKMRFHYEDRIDEIMDIIKDKCSDTDLVEELSSMAVDEAGWDGDWSELPNERARLSVVTKTPYTNLEEDKEEDRESPKSVADLISTSTHSLHIFNEEY